MSAYDRLERRCDVADESVQGVGREGGGAPDGAIPHRGHADPDGAVLRVLPHLRAQVGDRCCAGWTYAAMGRRIVTGRPIPGLLVLATLGISVRTVIYLLSGNDFVYFFQPIMRTAATAAVFAVSVRIGRPLIARFAADFCPISPDSRPARRSSSCSAGSPTCGQGQRRRRGDDLDAAADAARRCVRRHGDGLSVDHHLQRRRAHRVRLGPHGPQRRTPHCGRRPTGDCTRITLG